MILISEFPCSCPPLPAGLARTSPSRHPLAHLAGLGDVLDPLGPLAHAPRHQLVDLRTLDRGVDQVEGSLVGGHVPHQDGAVFYDRRVETSGKWAILEMLFSGIPNMQINIHLGSHPKIIQNYARNFSS